MQPLTKAGLRRPRRRCSPRSATKRSKPRWPKASELARSGACHDGSERPNCNLDITSPTVRLRTVEDCRASPLTRKIVGCSPPCKYLKCASGEVFQNKIRDIQTSWICLSAITMNRSELRPILFDDVDETGVTGHSRRSFLMAAGKNGFGGPAGLLTPTRAKAQSIDRSQPGYPIHVISLQDATNFATGALGNGKVCTAT